MGITLKVNFTPPVLGRLKNLSKKKIEKLLTENKAVDTIGASIQNIILAAFNYFLDFTEGTF
jgi:hypothetical protein